MRRAVLSASMFLLKHRVLRVQSFCICNAIKYLYRWQRKNGIEDIKKAKWYIDKFLELNAGESENG